MQNRDCLARRRCWRLPREFWASCLWGLFVVSRFVFVVSPSGSCWLASRRSGRRLSGGAVSACLRAVVRASRRSAAGLRRRASLARPCPLALALGSCARCLYASSCPGSSALRLPVPPLRFSSPRPPAAPLGSWAGMRGLSAVPGLPGASGSGSAAFLLSPAFRSAVASGSCPVALCLSVFSWPVRSAVLWALARVFVSPGVRALVAPGGSLAALGAEFVRASLASLGFSSSGRFWSSPARLSRAWDFLRLRAGRFPSAFSSLSGLCSPAAVRSALSGVARCLWWLGRRSGSCGGVWCPPAVRPALASAAWWVLAGCRGLGLGG